MILSIAGETGLKPKWHFHDHEYLKMVQYVLNFGVEKTDRTGTGTLSVFSYQMRFNLNGGRIPLLTTKKMHVRSIIEELRWYLTGSTSNNDLHANNVTIWDEWARPDGDLGPVYGFQWRKWPGEVQTTGNPSIGATIFAARDTHTGMGKYHEDYVYQEPIDQIAILIDKLKNNPDDRRLIVSAWNVSQLQQMALPPCHYAFQCYSSPGIVPEAPRQLSMMLNQRSADVGLGVPFNIVQYSILLRMLAEVTGHVPHEFIWNGGDVHIYKNHVEKLKEQLGREPFESPMFSFARPIDSIDDFKYDDFVISGYHSHPAIKMDVAI